MLKLAILKPKIEKNGQGDEKIVAWIPIFEDNHDQIERELIRRTLFLLGGKDHYNAEEITAAIKNAFDEYKREFKEKTVTLP